MIIVGYIVDCLHVYIMYEEIDNTVHMDKRHIMTTNDLHVSTPIFDGAPMWL